MNARQTGSAIFAWRISLGRRLATLKLLKSASLSIARAMESEADFKSFKVANLLPKEILHAKIADPVWRAFMRGEFDVAAFQAMKAVEVSVRAAAGLGDNLIGVKLMREAFAPEAGPLTDMNAEGGERVGRMELF